MIASQFAPAAAPVDSPGALKVPCAADLPSCGSAQGRPTGSIFCAARLRSMIVSRGLSCVSRVAMGVSPPLSFGQPAPQNCRPAVLRIRAGESARVDLPCGPFEVDDREPGALMHFAGFHIHLHPSTIVSELHSPPPATERLRPLPLGPLGPCSRRKTWRTPERFRRLTRPARVDQPPTRPTGSA